MRGASGLDLDDTTAAGGRHRSTTPRTDDSPRWGVASSGDDASAGKRSTARGRCTMRGLRTIAISVASGARVLISGAQVEQRGSSQLGDFGLAELVGALVRRLCTG
jgi:hypothetical protein